MSCGVLVPQPGVEPEPSELEAQNLNHWTTKVGSGTGFLGIAFLVSRTWEPFVSSSK